jgi:uncharacterized protein
MVFAIVLSPGPAWKVGANWHDQPLEAHGDYQHALWAEGRLQKGGPFGDGTGGLSIVEVADRAEAEAVAAADPAVQSGVFLAEVRPWFQVDWASYEPTGN